ncbi:MAG: flavin reductase family protein [Acidobacteria bacterium]|nr:flavin reductase family protein [Acidobacteriota bacterium]
MPRRQRIQRGDHTIFVGEVEAVHTDDKSPLIYWTGEYRTIANPIDRNRLRQRCCHGSRSPSATAR